MIRSDLLSLCKEELFKEIRETLHPDYLGLKENLSMKKKEYSINVLMKSSI